MEQETQKKQAKAVPQVIADESRAHVDLTQPKAKVEHRPDYYLIEGPDGKEFNASPNMYRRVYSKDEAKFKVKKSPTPTTK